MTKYYSEKQIYVSTFFGGSIPAGILIYKNFKRIGEDKKAALTLSLTFFFTIALFYGLIQLPDEISDKLPNVIFPSLYTFVVYLVYNKYLAPKINDKLIEPENKVSNWNVAGLTIMGFVINMIIIVAFVFSEPAFPGENIEYGALKHEIFFDEGDVKESYLQAVGKLLTDFEYFNDDTQQAVRIDYVGGKYLLNLSIAEDYWNDPGVLLALNKLQDMLCIMIEKEYKIVMIDYNLLGELLKKEL